MHFVTDDLLLRGGRIQTEMTLGLRYSSCGACIEERLRAELRDR
jgi:hypothetical protein